MPFIYFNQLRLKLLYTTIWQNVTPNIKLFLDKYNLKTLDDDEILENLFLLEFITNMKSVINYYKKSYKNIMLQISSSLRRKYLYYFLDILKIFYLPLMYRRNNAINLFFDKSISASFLIKQIKDLPLMPEIYYNHKNLINIIIYFPIFLKANKKKIFLISNYFIGLK